MELSVYFRQQLSRTVHKFRVHSVDFILLPEDNTKNDYSCWVLPICKFYPRCSITVSPFDFNNCWRISKQG